jgi:AcrR family transcriptional regulator
MSSSDRGARGPRVEPIEPLYERLPHGPHRLNHSQVASNQRIRLQGAMVEAVAARGYAGASISQLVGLAGVSRRSFYELFANKQELFLATFELIAARGIEGVRRAYQASEGALEARLRAAVEVFIEGIRASWNDACLVIVEAQTIGPAGLARVRRTTASCEQMLLESFAAAPDAAPLAMPVVGGIVGGLHAAASVCLRTGDAEQLPALAEDMLQWMLLFQTTAAACVGIGLAERMAAGVAQRMREGAADDGGCDGTGVAPEDDRGRLLHHALRLALIDDYKELSAPQIAEEANVPMDVFFELFAGKDECFLAALDTLGEELMRVVADPELRGGVDWPCAVRRVIAELLGFLAENPLYAQTIAAGAFAAGPQAAERNRDFMRGITALLIEGAPRPAHSRIVVEGIGGAIGHTIRCQVASGQIPQLPALVDPLAYVVLVPHIGAEATAEIVAGDPSRAA